MLRRKGIAEITDVNSPSGDNMNRKPDVSHKGKGQQCVMY